MKRPSAPTVTPGTLEYYSIEHLSKRLRVAHPAEENAVDVLGRKKGNLNPVDDVVDKTNPWQLAEIIEPNRCRLATLNASDVGNKVSGLLYTNSGTDIVVLGSSGLQKMWKLLGF